MKNPTTTGFCVRLLLLQVQLRTVGGSSDLVSEELAIYSTVRFLIVQVFCNCVSTAFHYLINIGAAR